ncbi:hypothetical protein [Microscilla marina]|nr:hypothetical protein [Microscilla marina]
MEKKLKLYVFAASFVLMLMLIFFTLKPVYLRASQPTKKVFKTENLKLVLQNYFNKVATANLSAQEKDRFANKIISRCESDGILVFYRYKDTKVQDTLSLASYLTRLKILGYRQPRVMAIQRNAQQKAVTELRIVEDRKKTKSDI